MMTSDHVSSMCLMVLHVVIFALNVQSNTKQMILYNMECRNSHPELGVRIVDVKLFGCSSAWLMWGSICSIIGSVMFISPTTVGGMIHSW